MVITTCPGKDTVLTFFGQLFRKPSYGQHGEIAIGQLVPEERSRVQVRRTLGIAGIVILSAVLLVFIFSGVGR